MSTSRKKNEDGFTESQLRNLRSAYFIISNNIQPLIELKKNDLVQYKSVLGSLRSQIFDCSFFKTGLKSEGAITLEEKLNSMTKDEKEKVKNDDAYKFTDEHPVNRVVISCLLIYLMEIKNITTFEQYIEFMRKYNVTIKLTKLEHNSLGNTTGYYVKGIEDYLGRNIFVLGVENVFDGMDIELIQKALAEIQLIEG
jgi:hypothetical protein